MEGNKMFDYENSGNKEAKGGKDMQETMVKILQLIIGFIMAVLHM